MRQLTYDASFNSIIEEPFNKTSDEDILKFVTEFRENIPSNILKFIENVSNSRYFKEEKSGNKYCTKCFSKLDKNNYCKKCKISYYKDKNINQEYLPIWFDFDSETFLDNLRDYEETSYYYVFQTLDNEVLLFKIEEDIYFDNPNTIKPQKTRHLEVKKVFHIFKDYVKELIENNYVSFKKIDKAIKDKKEHIYYNYEIIEQSYFTTLYLENLNELKTTIYKYSNIFEIGNIYNEIGPTFINLVYLPLHIKNFEYLVKKKLYYLAIDRSFLLEYDKDCKNILSNNDNLDFMIKNHMGYEDFMTFKLSKVKDMKFLKSLNFLDDNFEEIINLIKNKFRKIKEYFDSNKIDYAYLIEYFDYLNLAYEFGYDLKDKKILYPNNLMEEHDKLYLARKRIDNKNIDKDIQKLANFLTLNNYEDDKYIIIPAPSLESLIEESHEQQNCVRTYSELYSENETHIYFLREKKNPSKSLVTIEVRNGRIIQARTKFNKLPSEELMNVLNIWEKGLIRIDNDKSE